MAAHSCWSLTSCFEAWMGFWATNACREACGSTKQCHTVHCPVAWVQQQPAVRYATALFLVRRPSSHHGEVSLGGLGWLPGCWRPCCASQGCLSLFVVFSQISGALKRAALPCLFESPKAS